MWNSTSRPQLQAEARLARAARARRCRMRRVSIGTGVPSSNHASARIQPVAGAHGRTRKLAGSGSSTQVVGEAEAGQRVGRAGLEHAVGGAVGGVLEQDRADHADAARAARSAPRAATSVLPRSTPCRSHQPMRTSSMPSSLDAPRDRFARRRARRVVDAAALRRTTSSTGLGVEPTRRSSAARRRAPARPRRRAWPRPRRLQWALPAGRPARCSRSCPGPVSGGRLVGASSAIGGRPPARTVSIAFSSVRRLAMITLSLVPRCSRVRSWIAPMLSTAHWSCRLMSSSPMPR